MLKDCPRTDPPCEAIRPMTISRTATAPAPSQMVRIVFPRICITNLLLGEERGKKEDGTTARFLASLQGTSPLYLRAPGAPGDFPFFPLPCLIGCWSGAAIRPRATSR